MQNMVFFYHKEALLSVKKHYFGGYHDDGG